MRWKGRGERNGEKTTGEYFVKAKTEAAARDQVRERIEEIYDGQGIISVHVEPYDPMNDPDMAGIIQRSEVAQ
jgi:hypothetical protein